MDDAPMETADNRPQQDQINRLEEMATFVNNRVFELVTTKMHDDEKVVTPKDVVDADDMKDCMNAKTETVIEEALYGMLIGYIKSKYDVRREVAVNIAKETAADTVEKFEQELHLIPKLTLEEIEQLAKAFTQTEYVGRASHEFKEYVERCWKMHCKNLKQFKAPYATVVQSSGFGKSRMVFELARMALEPSSTHKVIYVCARTQDSSGYPVETRKLREWLFPFDCTSSSIASRLKVISQYAKENWETVQVEWLRLFTNPNADVDVFTKLNAFVPKISPDNTTSTSNTSSKKIVVLVIDEARSLLVETKNPLNRFRLLRRALQSAFTVNGGVFGLLIDTNSKISNFSPPLSADPSGRDGKANILALFPPFVLTHTMDLFWQKHCDEQAADEIKDDPMSGLEEKKKGGTADNKSNASDDTEEMGIDVTAYKDAVTGSEQDAWNALKRMGRPLWYTYTKDSESPATVVYFAAKKLLLMQDPGKDGYNEENMFGVASLLCRVGLRPYSTSPFASRAVADLMAILAYVNYEKDGYVSSYASDPVLALGAIEVWYGQNNALSQFILPQLAKLILNEVLDTGGIGEVVARIVLLLAMDQCVLGNEKYEYYTGYFISVRSFLKVLGADEMPVYTRNMVEPPSDTKEAYRTWLSKWDGWQMGFSHFVQLKMEPTVATLWYLLGRRAAGIFPRNQKGADLLIPIFWKKEDGDASFGSEMKSDDDIDAKVSFILIQVKNRAPHDSEFPKSATTKLCPSFVFGKTIRKTKSPVKHLDNPLSKLSVRDVICIYMNVQDEDNKHHRFIYVEKPEDEKKKSDSSGLKLADTYSKIKQSTSKEAAEKLRFTLCYRSVCCDTYTFFDAEVAKRLKSLVETLWNPLVLVDGDLKRRQEVEQSVRDQYKAVLSQAMGDEELKKIACKGLADPPGRQIASEKVQQSLTKHTYQGDQRSDSPKRQRRA